MRACTMAGVVKIPKDIDRIMTRTKIRECWLSMEARMLETEHDEAEWVWQEVDGATVENLPLALQPAVGTTSRHAFRLKYIKRIQFDFHFFCPFRRPSVWNHPLYGNLYTAVSSRAAIFTGEFSIGSYPKSLCPYYLKIWQPCRKRYK